MRSAVLSALMLVACEAPSIGVAASDAGDAAAPGVPVEFVRVIGAPSSEAKVTDSTGFGGFINVRPNTGIRVQATVADFAKTFETTVFTRPRSIARVHLPPM